MASERPVAAPLDSLQSLFGMPKATRVTLRRKVDKPAKKRRRLDIQSLSPVSSLTHEISVDAGLSEPESGASQLSSSGASRALFADAPRSARPARGAADAYKPGPRRTYGDAGPAAPAEASVIDPFTREYRSAALARSDAEPSALAVCDERAYRAPFARARRPRSFESPPHRNVNRPIGAHHEEEDGHGSRAPRARPASRRKRKRPARRAPPPQVLVDRPSDAPTAFEVRSYLGHGATGAVFEVERDDSDDSDDGRPLALKVERGERSTLRFEARLALAVRARTSPAPRAGRVVEPAGLWLWSDAQAMSMPRYDATLADVLRLAGGRTTAIGSQLLPEPVALFLAVAAMEAVLAVHDADVLHLDVKPDNFLAMLGEDLDGSACVLRGAGDVADTAAANGFGLVLIDFGRAVDRRSHAPGTRFETAHDHAHLAEFEWPRAVKDGRRKRKGGDDSWTTELDVYALGVCLHLLCSNRGPSRDGHRAALPRAWDRPLWTALLDAHLVVDGPQPTRDARAALVARARRALDARCPNGFASLLGPLLRHLRADD